MPDDEQVMAPDEPTDSTRDPMAKLRPDTPLGAQLARARMFGAMFGQYSTVGAFGRFRVLERLGEGGMGVVYEAYDPDLARGVALKLVKVTAGDRDTALAEAKALARLSHPNVVPIYDVGLERGHVYLVMELVRGKTLGHWSQRRTPAEILDVYRQAGVALAAAHDVGLVHRDFKPDNAIVGADGRVRVVDFGLACEAEAPPLATAAPRPVAGTPRYIAPEIRDGAAITPAADQYSFCVALAESLGTTGEPTPRQIAAVLERGRATDPDERFESMTQLLRVLAHDPTRLWRRIGALAGLAVSVGALAFVAGRQRANEVDVCDDGFAQLEAAWSPAARSAALGRISTLGGYDLWLRRRLELALDSHATAWVREYRSACLARHRRAESDTLSDRRTLCLRRSSDAVAAVGRLVASAELANLAELPRAVQSIPDPTACADLGALLSEIAPPPAALTAPIEGLHQQLAQAAIQLGAGRYEQAVAEARATVARARTLGYAPVLAEALLVQGHAQSNLADRSAAVPLLAEATEIAMMSHDDARVIEAWARRVWAQGTSSDPGGALAGLDLIEPIARRTASASFARALLYNNVGSVELGRGHAAQARAHFDRALTEASAVTGTGTLELVAIRANIGLTTEDRARGDKLLVEAQAELGLRLGPDHPDTLLVRWLKGFGRIEDLRQAADVLRPVCRGYELHPTLADRTARCWTEVALLRWDLGEREQASEAMTWGARAPNNVPEAAPYLSLLQGDAHAAARQFAAAAAARAPKADEPWWDRLSRAELTLGLGRARRELGELRGAREALERTIADLEPIVREHPAMSYQRRLGRARVELAFTLSSMGASAADRAASAAAAAAWLRQVGGASSELSRLERLRIP